ncbi:unnamed protein product [Somion occarium]|uniref:RecQ-mediated genome instability protein 1 n=1 Tax=Somion occarium TaxID=3059160 RepID=A0ABP1E8K2_9APHY
MPPPKEIVEWLNQRYPKPKVDPDWLEGCYSWIEETHELDPATQMDAIIGHVTAQLLSSDFADSMRPKTGLTSNIHALKKCTMKGPPILLELVSLTEIAHSAFNLMNVRQTRIDREDLAGLGEDIDDQGNMDEDEGPVPRYPRGMLKMELSDGFTTLNAIEYRRIPDLELGVTPLGCKVQIHNVDIRNGVALLEPKNFTILGYQTEDRVAQQDADFVRSLKRRLQLPEDEPAAPGEAPPAPPPGPPPAPAPMPAHPRAPSEAPVLAQSLRQPRIRSPPREASAPLEPGPSHAPHVDEEQRRRRKVPARSPSPLLPPPPAQARQTHSRFFHGSGAGSNHGAQDNSDDLAEYLRLSPHRESSRLVNSSGDEIEDWQIAERSTRPRRPAASKTARTTEKQAQLAANNQAESDTDVDMAVPTDGSSEFDFDDVGGASFFAEVDKVEKAALSQYAGSQDRTQVGTQVKIEQTQAARSTTGVTNTNFSTFDTATLVGGSSQSAPGRGSSSSGGSRNPPSSSSRGRGSSVPVDGSSRSQYARVNLGVIDLLDDDEEDREKENIPAQSKYVRRRTATPAAAVYDVIEISD